jgi:hypothetical protein
MGTYARYAGGVVGTGLVFLFGFTVGKNSAAKKFQTEIDLLKERVTALSGEGTSPATPKPDPSAL